MEIASGITSLQLPPATAILLITLFSFPAARIPLIFNLSFVYSASSLNVIDFFKFPTLPSPHSLNSGFSSRTTTSFSSISSANPALTPLSAQSIFVWAAINEISFFIISSIDFPTGSSLLMCFIPLKNIGWCDTIKSHSLFTASSIICTSGSKVISILLTSRSASPTSKPTLSHEYASAGGAKSSIFFKISFTLIFISYL